MQLRIPAGGLVISMDGSAPPPTHAVVRLDTWQHWLRIAMPNTVEASRAHAGLLESLASADQPRAGECLQAEFQAAMVSMTASAFALDAFYGVAKERIPRLPDVETAWAKNRTKRTTRIAETLRRGFVLGGEGQRLDHRLSESFKARDWAAHPPAEFASPVAHPDLGVGVEWRFVAFSASNAITVNRAALDIISRCLRSPNPRHAEVVQWVEFGAVVIGPILQDFEAAYGPVSRPLPAGNAPE